MDPCRGGIACEICLGRVLLLFVDTVSGSRYPLALQPGPATALSISHAIPLRHRASSYRSATLCHLCF